MMAMKDEDIFYY